MIGSRGGRGCAAAGASGEHTSAADKERTRHEARGTIYGVWGRRALRLQRVQGGRQAGIQGDDL